MPSKKFKITRSISLILYLACALVLIIESCQNEQASSSHSSNVGNFFAGLINSIKGDQAVLIEPTDVQITNKDNPDELEAHPNEKLKLNVKTISENSSFQS